MLREKRAADKRIVSNDPQHNVVVNTHARKNKAQPATGIDIMVEQRVLFLCIAPHHEYYNMCRADTRKIPFF